MQLSLPPLIAVEQKVHQNKIRRLEWAEHEVELEAEPYDRFRVQGLLLDGPDGDILVVDRKSHTKTGEYLLQVEDLDAPLTWHTGKWLRPKPGDLNDEGVTCENVLDSWVSKFEIIEEQLEGGEVDVPGLRSPQVGALYAALAHWRVSQEEATIVLPTGTGKTEAMLAIYTHQRLSKLLVVVPTDALRTQIGEKFEELGVLKKFGVLKDESLFPFVGLLKKGLKTADQAREFLGEANVVVATMPAIRACSASARRALAEECSHMFVDEAHHLGAQSWRDFRRLVVEQEGVVLQFTATPFREDGRRLPGKIIFDYPLRKAQSDGYFTRIRFLPVLEFDEADHDREVAETAVTQLQSDRAEGYEHVLMARCANIPRATEVHGLYQQIADDHSPILLHSGLTQDERRIAVRKLFDGEARIVVCVDMFGEGFDYPPLKIGALHDVHKSIGVTLQFTGRFARSRDDLGDATIVANLARTKVSDALERLYAEDADWNRLLSFIADQATREEQEVHEFMEGFPQLAESPISIRNITPAMSTVVYEGRIPVWRPNRIARAFEEENIVGEAYVNAAENLVFVITRNRREVGWGSISHLLDVSHELYVAFWDEEHQLLFIHGSERQRKQRQIATELLRPHDPIRIDGNQAFRVFGDVQPLTLLNLGLKDSVNRRVRFRMFVGSDIRDGLDELEQQNRIMTNTFGRGYQEGRVVDYGSSAKGKIWSYRTARSLLEWKRWCETTAERIRNDAYTTNYIMEHVLRPEPVGQVPEGFEPLSVAWDDSVWRYDETRLYFEFDGEDFHRVPLLQCEVQLVELADERDRFRVAVSGAAEGADVTAVYLCKLGDGGMAYEHIDGPTVEVSSGGSNWSLNEFLQDNPLHFRFSAGALLISNMWYEIDLVRGEVFDADQMEAWDWAGVDLTKESLWKNGEERPDSIQAHVLERIGDEDFDLIFNDDDRGEAADIIAFKVDEAERTLRVVLYHLKFTKDEPGQRVKDHYTVCGQAQTSAHWKTHLAKLFPHMLGRAAKAEKRGLNRYVRGGRVEISECEYWAGRLDLDFEIVIVQPGVQQSALTDDQKDLLAATRAYLHHTLAIPLRVIGSP